MDGLQVLPFPSLSPSHSQLIPLPLPLDLIPLVQPGMHMPQLPLMRGTDEIRLGVDVQNPIAVPMVARAGDLHLLRAVARAGVVAVVAHVAPHVARPVDQHQPRRRDLEVPVLVVPC